MADGFKMIAQRPPADGEAVFQDYLGFRLGERVAFQCVAAVSELDFVVCTQRGNFCFA